MCCTFYQMFGRHYSDFSKGVQKGAPTEGATAISLTHPFFRKPCNEYVQVHLDGAWPMCRNRSPWTYNVCRQTSCDLGPEPDQLPTGQTKHVLWDTRLFNVCRQTSCDLGPEPDQHSTGKTKHVLGLSWWGAPITPNNIIWRIARKHIHFLGLSWW